MDAPLHLFRPCPLLFLPPVGPQQGSRLRAADIGNPALKRFPARQQSGVNRPDCDRKKPPTFPDSAQNLPHSGATHVLTKRHARGGDRPKGRDMKKRWMKSVIDAANTETAELPWTRGARRAKRKAAARARALAA
ncbi:hypothetical protein STA1M1_08840 [Sinisalibacter aestuarii]|uniref:Uncharacterized protein n=1 Tax=Sinisalibacter aestuarii TaxID=2949426 RepID=A0ABQ5LPU4_9RHOB|nr:hypothetical protein STA1M1_08840 [Sinisalibacter aestuarii]